MPDFIVTTTSGDSNDPKQFEANVLKAKARGYTTISLAPIQQPTWERATDPNDTWEYFTFINAALFNIFETSLINGYLKPATYRLNQDALKWKSEILLRHAMRGSLHLREPQWMPTQWFEDGREELKGCRCEHPSVALSPHWAVNIDHPAVLEHYHELGRKLAELAPAVCHLLICTNDSGAGINWCQGLYPGPNGPADTKNRDMGERIENWFASIRQGGRDANVNIEIDFDPTHFTPPELKSLAKALTCTRLQCNSDDPRTSTFPNVKLQVFLDACQGTKTQLLYAADVSNGYVWSGMIAPPQLYFAGETLMELKHKGVQHLASSYSAETPLSNDGSPLQVLFERCINHCPDNLAEVEQMVIDIARELVGETHAPAMLSAWRDVDTAIRVNRMDYHHNYYFFYGLIGRRWLTRPLVPNPKKLNNDERTYWSKYIMQERDPDLAFNHLLAEENRIGIALDEYAAYYNGFELMAKHFERAVDVLEKRLTCAKQDSLAWRWLKDQRDRIEFFGCMFKTQLHVTGMQWVIDRFADNPNPSKHAAKREKKRMYDMIDGEIDNCRRMIELLRNPIAPLLSVGDESTYVLPRNVPQLLEKKISVMRAHRDEVEELFPGVGVWNFDKPVYKKSGEIVSTEEAELD